ncbi:MAG: hypothetical protein ABW190_02275, partial [Rhizobacter sp.]
MTSTRRAWLMAAAVAVGAGTYLGMRHMGLISSNRNDLRRLLGPTGADIVDDDTPITAWSPDPNYKPESYYLTRSLDENGFR